MKSTCVDLIEMRQSQDINLHEEPCIFPNCGYFLTMSSMDGQMDMSADYSMDSKRFPTEIKGLSEPFSMTDIGAKVCATCRGSLRDISRYGQAVHEPMLDKAMKKFLSLRRMPNICFLRKVSLWNKRDQRRPRSSKQLHRQVITSNSSSDVCYYFPT